MPRGALRERLRPTPSWSPAAALVTPTRARTSGQRCGAAAEHGRRPVLRRGAPAFRGLHGRRSSSLSCSKTTRVPFLPIPRLQSGPVFGPRRGAACASTCLPPPRVELTVRVRERTEHLDEKGPQVDRLAVHFAVVPRVRGEDLVELARDAAFERHRCQGPHPLELHSCLASVYGPGKMTSCVTITVNG